MYREVNFFEDNGGGLSAVVKENDKVVKVLTGFEYGNFNTGDFIDDAANGFPNADEFDHNDWNGLTLEKAAEEVSNHCIGIDLIATVGRNCRSKEPAVHATVKQMDTTTQTATRIHLVNVSLLPKTKGLYLHKLVDHQFS